LDDVTPVDEPILFPTIPSPNLMILDFYFPYSWAALTALKYLIPHPIQLEHICLSDVGSDTLQFPAKFVKSLRDILSMLRPVDLELFVLDYFSVRFFLRALDLKSLQRLQIKPYPSRKNNPLQGHTETYPFTPSIAAPNLTYLVTQPSPLQSSIRFHTRLSANNLKHLEAEIRIDSKDIKLQVRASSGQKSDDESEEQLLYESLGPNTEGRVRFPKLSTSRITFTYSNFENHEEANAQRDILVLGLKRSLCNVLRNRSMCKATRLVLQEAVQVEVLKQGIPPIFDLNIVILLFNDDLATFSSKGYLDTRIST